MKAGVSCLETLDDSERPKDRTPLDRIRLPLT